MIATSQILTDATAVVEINVGRRRTSTADFNMAGEALQLEFLVM